MKWIKEIWGKILPFLKAYKIFKFLSSKTFLFLIVLILAIILGRACGNIRDNQRIIRIREQNIIALTDTLKEERTISEKQQISIAGYISSINELQYLNQELYNEVIDQKGNVLSLNKVIFQLKQDTTQLRSYLNHIESIINQPIQLNDSTYRLTWVKRYDWDSINYDIFNGQTIVGLTIKPEYTWKDAINMKYNIIELKHNENEIISRESQISLKLGQKVENNQLRIFVQSNYPGFTVTSLEGILIDPNTNKDIQDLLIKKRWLPNTLSVGVGTSFGFDVFSKRTYLGIGVNINYNIIQW